MKIDLNKEIEKFEVSLILKALIHNAGNIGASARSLSVHRTTLHEKLKRYFPNIYGAGGAYDGEARLQWLLERAGLIEDAR